MIKLLADENTPRTIVEALRHCGYDLLWVREYCRGMTDEEIICLSLSEKRVILILLCHLAVDPLVERIRKFAVIVGEKLTNPLGNLLYHSDLLTYQR